MTSTGSFDLHESRHQPCRCYSETNSRYEKLTSTLGGELFAIAEECPFSSYSKVAKDWWCVIDSVHGGNGNEGWGTGNQGSGAGNEAGGFVRGNGHQGWGAGNKAYGNERDWSIRYMRFFCGCFHGRFYGINIVPLIPIYMYIVSCAAA